MAIKLLELLEAVRDRLDDHGGDRGPPSAGYYAQWQQQDDPCCWKNRELLRALRTTLADIAVRSPWADVAASVAGDMTLDISAHEPTIPLPDNILAIDDIRLRSTGAVLIKTDIGRLQAQAGDSWPQQHGIPTHYFEPRHGLLRLYPTPAVADALEVTARRHALATVTWESIAHEAVPTTLLEGVPDDLEEALIVGVCRQAYLKADAAGFDPRAAERCEQQFNSLVGPPVSWRQQEARRANANFAVAMRGHSYYR